MFCAVRAHYLPHPRAPRGRFHLPPLSSHSKVIINSPALVGHNQLRATPTLFIGRQHATSARRGAARRVPLFKPTPRLETPEKESRTRLLHSHRAVRALVFPPLPSNYLRLHFRENGRPKCGRMEQKCATGGCPWVAAADPWRRTAARGVPLPAWTHARGQRQRPTRLVGSRAASWHRRGTRQFIRVPAALALPEHRLLPRWAIPLI